MSRLDSGTLLILLAVSPGAARAECDPLGHADLLVGVHSAYASFQQMDRAGFETTRDDIVARLSCMSEPLQPADAASLHGMMALSAFLAKDDIRSVGSLHAAALSDPDFQLPAEMFPDGHPLHFQLRVARELPPGEQQRLPRQREGELSIDGRPAHHAPTERPSVLQWTEDRGEVLGTWYLDIGAPLPTELAPPAPGDHPWMMVVSSGGAAALAGGLGLLAARSHGQFTDPDTPYDDLPGLQRQANGLTLASGAAGLLSVGLGAAAVLRW
jgi:hypothetical protein